MHGTPSSAELARLKIVRFRVDNKGMEAFEQSTGTVLLLEYPNGRTVERTLPAVVSVGDQFEMHGRRWHAVAKLEDRRPRPVVPTRILCRSLGPKTINVIDDPRD